MTQTQSSVRGDEPDDEVPPMPRRSVPRVPDHEVPELPAAEALDLAQDEVPETPEPPLIAGQPPVQVDEVTVAS
jgi:hypothetical protein